MNQQESDKAELDNLSIRAKKCKMEEVESMKAFNLEIATIPR